MLGEIRESWRYRAVVENFVWTSLGVRYRRSFLGYLWSVLSPVAKYAIMGVVFEIIGRFQMQNYYGFMFIGSIFFGFFSTVVSQATTAFINNEHYIKKIYVPKLVFVLNIVLYETVNFLLVFSAIAVILLVWGQLQLSWAWLFIPVALTLTIVTLIGMSSLIAVATIYFRDLQHLTDILFQALFFATPIFYPVATIQKDVLFWAIASLNPVLYFVSLFRDPLITGEFPNLITVLICAVIALVSFVAGVVTINKFNNRIIFKL